MKINTYLTFRDNCREAFEYYRNCFGGDFESLSTFADGPADMGIDKDYGHLIMHVSLPIGSGRLMGSDYVPGFGPPLTVGNNFSLSLQPASREEADAIFEKLSDGGAVTMPLQETFWGSYFGALTDRFGVNWQVNFDLSTR